MRIAVVFVTEEGKKTAEALAEELEDCTAVPAVGEGVLKRVVPQLFSEYEGIVFVMALGIVVRVIAPCVRSKYTDPAVVVVDDASRYCISTLSGHEGGANRLAYEVAAVLGSIPIVTTASETNKIYIIGVGCRKGTTADEILDAFERSSHDAEISLNSVRVAATAWIKRKEAGLIEACDRAGIPLVFVERDGIELYSCRTGVSPVAYRNIGIQGVCEPCALSAGRKTKLIMKKKIYGKVTIAIAKEYCS